MFLRFKSVDGPLQICLISPSISTTAESPSAPFVPRLARFFHPCYSTLLSVSVSVSVALMRFL